MLKTLKNHYEKVILSAVLLGAVVVVALLPSKITAEQEYLEALQQQILRKIVKPLPEFSFAHGEDAIARRNNPIELNFSAPPHNLVNPVLWTKGPDGRPHKEGSKADRGVSKIQATNFLPLYLTVSLESISTATITNYLMKTERETETTAKGRTKSGFVTLGGKSDFFVLREVKGPADKPEELVIEMLDTHERGVLTPTKPFKRVDGYTVDIKYEVGSTKKSYTRQRQGALLRDIDGEDYIISAINRVADGPYEVVFSAKQTQKKTTIKFNAP